MIRGDNSGFRLALVGCNHRSASLESRERMTFTPEQASDAAGELCVRGIVAEAMVVSTCNRSEVYGVADADSLDAAAALESFFLEFHGIAGDPADGRLYRRSGMEAVRHLFRVAAGLDSMLLGEAEILGQLRDTYGKALEQGTTGPVLNRLFQAALELGKRVRTETALGARPVSVAFAGVKLAESVFGDLAGHSALVAGSGAVATQVIEHLRRRGIGDLRIVSRTYEHAESLARKFEAQAAGWDHLESSVGWADVVVTSVAGGVTVVDRAMLEKSMAARKGRAVFIMDLGVPRNVEPAAAEVYNAYLYNVDDLGEIVERNRQAREAEIPGAEALVEEHVGKFDAWRNSVEAVTLIEDLRRQLHEERRLFLREQRRIMDHLAPEQREAVERLTENLVERLLKGPAKRLRHAPGLRERIEELEIFRDLFGGREERG